MEESMIKVSVIIPIYNVRDYIEECLVSVVNQTLTEIEIICVDDGTLDDSMDIIEKYAVTDKRIVILHKENGGLSSARNAGLKFAQGEYVYFLDSDDLIIESTLENLYDEMVTYDLDTIFFDADSFFENEELAKKHKAYQEYYHRQPLYEEVVPGQKLFLQMEYNNDFRPSACLQMNRRTLLIDNQIYFKEGIIHEDNLFTMKLLLYSRRSKHIAKSFYQRRVRENSIMTSKGAENSARGYFSSICRIVPEMLEIISDEEVLDAYVKRTNAMYRTAINAFKNVTNAELNELEICRNDIEDILFEVFVRNNSQWIWDIERRGKNNAKRLMNENKKLKKRIKALEHSHSYRIGRTIIWIPSKIKLLLKTIRTTGWKYIFSTLYRKLNKNKVCVSIIMPVYNAASYLEECLNSLVKQSLYNIEIICVNDGSTDESLNILQEFAKQDKRFHIINKENTGAGDSRNVGMKYAKGEYLLFLDSDDLFHKDLCYQVYRRAKIDNADICFTGAERINMKTNQKEYMGWVLRTALLPPNTPFQKETMEDKYFQLCSGCPWSKLFRRNFIQEHQLEFQNLKNSNDVYFVRTAMALADRLTYVDKRLITYRFAEGDNTQSNKHKNPLEFYKAYKALKEKLVNENIYSQLEKTFVNMVFDDCMFNYRTTDTEEAKNLIRKKLLEEGIAFFEFSKYPDSYFENKNNVKDFRTAFETQTINAK